MSGILGIVNLDGAPVDPALLRKMAGSLAFRGPDAQETWIGGNVGLGHTMLRTTWEAEHERQPCSLDGQVWITADARIDARSDLIAALRSKGQEVAAGVPDVELILHAYQVWGESCVEHLLGDFAFAIWDAPRKRFFCARDHLGVKPFYYAQAGQTVAASNTLDCVRIHPLVMDRLNDLAIADFLLFGFNQEFGTTVYADIQRLPPAHTASWSPEGFALKRYWTLPIDEPIYYRRGSDYVERFRELLNAAVEDRMRTDKLAVFMSGGLDSTTLAAVACSSLRKQGRDFEVHAFTSVFDDYGDDRRYPIMIAEHLNIPIHFRVGGRDDCVDPNWDQTCFHTPEPVAAPLNHAKYLAWFQEVFSCSRVFFWGEGSDNALTYEWRPYLKYLIGRGRYLRALSDTCRHIIHHRRIPLLPSIPRMIQDRFDSSFKKISFPPWLNPEFESRYELRARWEDHRAQAAGLNSLHSIRPGAYESFTGPLWQALFGGVDCGNHRASLEARHPFVDLRLLRYMLAVPAMPWCRVKYLQREAMRGILPEPVRRHRKTMLRGDPVWDMLRGSKLPALACAAQSEAYISAQRLPGSVQDRSSFYRDFAARGLDYWLKNKQKEHI